MNTGSRWTPRYPGVLLCAPQLTGKFSLVREKALKTSCPWAHDHHVLFLQAQLSGLLHPGKHSPSHPCRAGPLSPPGSLALPKLLPYSSPLVCVGQASPPFPLQGPGHFKNNQPTNQTKTDEQLWTASGNLTEATFSRSLNFNFTEV